MPGANCSIFGCSTSRSHVGISLHRIPKKDDEFSTNWRQKLVQVITRDRVIDTSLRRQIEKRDLCICELHFSEEKLLRRKYLAVIFTLNSLQLIRQHFWLRFLFRALLQCDVWTNCSCLLSSFLCLCGFNCFFNITLRMFVLLMRLLSQLYCVTLLQRSLF